MDYYGKLKQNLKKSAKKKIIIYMILIVIFVMFMFTLSNNIINISTVKRVNDELIDQFTTLYDSNMQFIESDMIKDKILTVNDVKHDFALNNSLARMNNDNTASSDISIYDANLKLIYSSYTDDNELTRRSNNTKAILSANNNVDSDTVFNSVYNIGNGFSDLSLNKVIVENGEIIGYATMYISGYDWSYYLLSNYSTDSIITDLDGNLVLYTKPILLENRFKFDKTQSKIQINDTNYYAYRKQDSQRGYIIYTISLRQDNLFVVYMLISTALVGLFWYRSSTNITEVVIDNNIRSVTKLIDQISLIEESDEQSRISMETDDEYMIIEESINEMLDRIKNLNTRNTELIKLNSNIEIKQLLSQYHPHFLYNTLEIIRSSMYYDRETAEDLIIQLTRILKYSIENPLKDVRFNNDFMYIKSYLDIQKARFSDNFNYSLDFDDNVDNAIVPKLVLQPIIENSIKYGFKQQSKVNINIRGYIKNNYLILEVEDDGPGIKDDELVELNLKLASQTEEFDTSIGLYNIARRLKLHYSNSSGILLENTTDGLLTRIIIKQRNDEDVL